MIYKNVTTPYLADLQYVLLERDNGMCVCEINWLEIYDTPDHFLIYYCDGDKTNGSLENLITLCNYCYPEYSDKGDKQLAVEAKRRTEKADPELLDRMYKLLDRYREFEEVIS